MTEREMLEGKLRDNQQAEEQAAKEAEQQIRGEDNRKALEFREDREKAQFYANKFRTTLDGTSFPSGHELKVRHDRPDDVILHLGVSHTGVNSMDRFIPLVTIMVERGEYNVTDHGDQEQAPQIINGADLIDRVCTMLSTFTVKRMQKLIENAEQQKSRRY
jgi:hypothetical protein